MKIKDIYVSLGNICAIIDFFGPFGSHFLIFFGGLHIHTIW